MSDLPRGDVVRPFARVISGLDVALLAGLAELETTATMGSEASASLDTLIAVTTSDEVGAPLVELHVVVREDVAHLVPFLGAEIAKRVPAGRSVHATALIAGDDLGGDLGDRAALFSSGVAEGDVEKFEAVFVNGTAGPAEVRRTLGSVGDAWGVPTLLMAGDVVYTGRGLGDMTSSRLLEALRFALTTKVTPENDIQVLARGFEGLVRRDGARYAATRSLEELLQEERFIGLPDHYSACAELLRRKGRPDLADELRRLIDHWVRHRIWSVNYVREMVLHDEAHSAAVDRNVASICGTLLAAKAPVIKEWDVFVLALCAWLHDWGHASARVRGIPTDPMEVRNYHGYLTSLRLDQEPGQHGISDRVIAEGARVTGQEQLKDEVALLCSHHQGWTSCGSLPGVDVFEPLPNFSVIGGGRGFGKRKKEAGVDVTFRKDYKRRLPRGATYGRDYDHVRRLLAILRLADASDVGAHRVPDFGTQGSNRQAHHSAFLGELERILTMRASAASRAAGEEGAIAVERENFREVENTFQRMIAVSLSQPVWKDGEIDARIAAEASTPLLQELGRAPGAHEGPGEQIVRWAWQYSVHVARQVAFYQHHHRVRAAIPVLEPSGEHFQLVVHVVPMARPGDGEHATAADITQAVVADVVREYGGSFRADGSLQVNTSDKAHKAELEAVLSADLGIRTRAVCGKPFVVRSRETVPTTAPDVGPRLAVPAAVSRSGFGVSAPSGAEWYVWGADGPRPTRSIEAGAPVDVRGLRALALTGDGMHAAAATDGVIEVCDLRTGQAIRGEVAGGCGSVLAIQRELRGFDVVYTASGRVWRTWIPLHGMARVPAPVPDVLAESPARGVLTFDAVHVCNTDGTVTGTRADSLMAGYPALRALDAVLVPEPKRVVWAAAPADASGTVLVCSVSASWRDVRVEIVVEGTAPVTDVVWVREPRDDVARLVVLRGRTTSLHDVRVEA